MALLARGLRISKLLPLDASYRWFSAGAAWGSSDLSAGAAWGSSDQCAWAAELDPSPPQGSAMSSDVYKGTESAADFSMIIAGDFSSNGVPKIMKPEESAIIKSVPTIIRTGLLRYIN